MTSEYCFSVLECHFDGLPIPVYNDNTEYPLFVSWHSSESGLRGCIGTFSPLALKQGLVQFVHKSAFNDTRFTPITKAELAHLSCTVSLLHSFEETTLENVDLELHGISFRYKNYSATFLPRICQGWSKMETMQALLQKSGYPGALNETLLAEATLTRYQSTVSECSYNEYKVQQVE